MWTSLRYNIGVAITPNTRKEDEQLKKELQNADLEKFKKAVAPVLFPKKKKKTTSEQKEQ